MVEEVEIDQAKVKELVESIKSQFIDPYKDVASLHEITSTTNFKDSDPLSEIQKLSQLIKAHSTKIGIVCQASKFFHNYPAVFQELQGFTNAVFYLLSILPLFHHDKDDAWAEYMVKRLDSLILSLLKGVSALCDEMEKMFKEGEIASSEKSDNDRLFSIGVIWAACDSLEELAKKGNFQLLSDSIYNSCALVDDVLKDIDSWLMDPQFGDELLLDEESSDSETEIKSGTPSDEVLILKRMETFLIEWKTNLRMIKLLLSSFAKSLVSNVYNCKECKGSTLDKLDSLQLLVVERVDEFMSDVFMSDASFQKEDFNDDILSLDDSLSKMVKVIKKLNTRDPKKTRWIQVWENKYFQERPPA